jgi:3-isopropylmalate/(R)-2-methylmalate dehydratase small subunit
MRKITKIQGKTIPLPLNDVDTDLIIPAQYLTAVSRSGYGEHLFKRLKENQPDFVFNQPQFQDGKILITQENFGCGSSREHAVWALQEAGIEAIIASSFADIFASNSAKNGLLLIQQPKDVIQTFLKASQTGDYYLTIDLEKQSIAPLNQEGSKYCFEMDSFRQYCFLNGLDDLDYLLKHKKEIADYEQKKRSTS